MKLVNVHLHAILVVFMTLAAGYYTTAATQHYLSLQDCIDTSLRNNLQLEAAQNQTQIQSARKRLLQAKRLPQIAAQANYQYAPLLPYQYMPLSAFNGPEGQFREVQFGVPHNINTAAVINWPVYQPGLQGKIDAADQDIAIAELQLHREEEVLIQHVTAAYYQLLYMHEKRNLVDSNMRNAGQLKNKLSLLNSKGLARRTDIEKVDLQIEELAALRSRISADIAGQKNQLQLLMGMDSSETWELIPEWPEAELPLTQPTPTTQQLIMDRELQRLELEHKEIMQSNMPRINLTAQLGYNGFGYDGEDPFLNFHPYSFAAVQAGIPLWNPSRKKQLELNRAMTGLARTKSRAYDQQRSVRLENAHIDYRATASYYRAAESRVALAERLYRATLTQHEQGVADLTELLLADNELRTARHEQLNQKLKLLLLALDIRALSNGLNR